MTPIERTLDEGSPPMPWLYEYAAELEGVDPDAMRTDAGAIARSLASAADLFGLPAVAPGFDTTLEAEAAGASVSVDAAGDAVVDGPVDSVEAAMDVDVDSAVDHECLRAPIDATGRLTTTLDDASALGAVTGPRELVDGLLAEVDPEQMLLEEATLTASDLELALANAYLDEGADGLVVLEPDGPRDTALYEDAILPLTNVCDHYGVPSVLVQRRVTEADVELAAAQGFDAITGVPAGPETVEAARTRDATLAVGIPTARFREDEVDAFLEAYPDDALVSSEWTVPPGVPPETLHGLMGSLDA